MKSLEEWHQELKNMVVNDSGHNLVQPSNFKILMQVQSKGINIRKIAEGLLI